MPFFDKKIELAIISHPDKDHIGGFLPITDHYQLNLIYSVSVAEPTLTFSQLLTKIKKNKIIVFQPFAGYQIRILNDFFTFTGRQKISGWIPTIFL
jgi:beta-lactamase superfamily II metal-dependent hydrolase